MNRETIYQALFTRLQTLPGFNTVSRRLQHWTDVDAIKQPALYQVQKTETPVGKFIPGQPNEWTLHLDLILYANVGEDPGAVGASLLNPLIDSIESLFAPDAVGRMQTLGGLVKWARISGAIETDEGVLGAQSVAVIPIEIVAAA